MSKSARLIFVSSQNNNKFYNMDIIGDNIKVEYGRVGATKINVAYPIWKWDSLYKSKIRKGYTDITSLCTADNNNNLAPIKEPDVARIVDKLQQYARETVSNNYTVTSSAVTEKQVTEAQKIINQLLGQTNTQDIDINTFNSNLIRLYKTIPRKMSNVKDHLLEATDSFTRGQQIIENEQSLLDVMEGQVKLNKTTEAGQTILESNRINILPANSNDIYTIKEHLGEIQYKFSSAWQIENQQTVEKFNRWTRESKDKTIKLFWHGSRNENWWNIVSSGLLLRPTNVIRTGTMFGNGIYFADKARKSLGYTSINGSYWARGSSDEGFMALYQVHLGNSLAVKRHEGWMYSLDEIKLKQRGEYDSLFAQGGADLINNEYIIYNENQSTIKYLVELH